MSFTRRKFVLGMGTVIFFTGSASSLLANTRQEKEVRYAMIHDVQGAALGAVADVFLY